jgi:hypothetical protein
MKAMMHMAPSEVGDEQQSVARDKSRGIEIELRS